MKLPVPGLIVPFLTFHVGVEAHALVDTETLGHVHVILLDLVSFRKEPAPLRVSCKGVLVGEGWHIDAQARVVILVPAATNIVGAFQQHDVSDTRLQQLDPGCNAAGPGADDGDLEFWLFAAHFATRFSKGCRRDIKPSANSNDPIPVNVRLKLGDSR
ncbi:Uncharacterised protein [Mycobacteroides abscessus]|nr:Uncharacterised protein [Mycobacteroides abscessus]